MGIGVDEQVTSLEKQCEDFAHDERKISKQIRKKRTELERHEKRLKSLESVRPAFMDEYEKLEVDLKREYEVYLEKFRELLKVARLLKKAQDLKETKEDEDDDRMHATPAEIDQTRV